MRILSIFKVQTACESHYLRLLLLSEHAQFPFDMSHVMRKPVLAIWEQQRRRSACSSVQSDQCLCYSLLR